MPIRVATVRAADVPASQTNFPFYVDLGRVGATTLTLADAHSSRWYTDTDLVTEMAREIVSVSEAHGKYASFTSTSKIAIDYDGIRADYAVTATFGRNAVWAAYRAVFHLDDLVDSTGNGYTLTNNNSVTMNATGKLGGSADFTSGNSNKTLSNATDLGMSLTSYTVDMWLRLYDVTAFGQGPWIINDATTRRVYGYFENSGGASMRFAHEGNANTQFNAVSAWTNDVWRKYTHTWDNTTQTGYLNGASGGSTSPTGNTSIVNSTFRLGAHQADVAPSLYWKGRIDEARVTDSTRDANWITTEYNNQNDEATFWGTWTTFSGSFNPAFGHRRLMI